MTDQGPLGRPPRGASVPGGAPCGAGPQLISPPTPPSPAVAVARESRRLERQNINPCINPGQVSTGRGAVQIRKQLGWHGTSPRVCVAAELAAKPNGAMDASPARVQSSFIQESVAPYTPQSVRSGYASASPSPASTAAPTPDKLQASIPVVMVRTPRPADAFFTEEPRALSVWCMLPIRCVHRRLWRRCRRSRYACARVARAAPAASASRRAC
jgi:hypothetical protein